MSTPILHFWVPLRNPGKLNWPALKFEGYKTSKVKGSSGPWAPLGSASWFSRWKLSLKIEYLYSYTHPGIILKGPREQRAGCPGVGWGRSIISISGNHNNSLSRLWFRRTLLMKTMLLVGANSPKPPRLPPPFHDCPRCPKTICCWSPFASHHPSPQSASQPAPFQPIAAQHLHSSLISLLLRSNK